MTDQTPTPARATPKSPRRRRGPLVLRSLGSFVIVAAIMGLLSVMAGALFNTSEYVTNNVFTFSTVILDANPSTAAFSVPSIDPGEEAVAEFTVANAGTAELRYAVTSETSEDVLASELVLTVKSGVTTCDQANWAATGTVQYQGILGDTTTVGGLPLVGDATTGADAGDRVLAASASEPLCFHVVLPAASTVQNASTTATFNFVAEQTANN